MDYQIEIRDIEPIRVAYMKYIGIAIEANKVFPNVFKAIMGKANGASLFNYLSMNQEKKSVKWSFAYQPKSRQTETALR